MNKLVIIFLFALNCFPSFSQETTEQQIILHPKTLQFAEDVYKNCPDYLQQSYLLEYSTQIKQITVLPVPEGQTTDFPLLSSVALKNKCNPELTRDEQNFNPENFNPLKYFLNFYSQADVYYQVDNAQYVIHITHR